jgi:hypothetical protein
MIHFSRLLLMALAASIGITAAADAGVFRKRNGEPRQPIRNLIAAVANRASGDCAAGNSACSTCSAPASGLQGACNDATCDEAATKAFMAEGESPHPEGFAAQEFAGPIDRLLQAREARLGPLEKIVFKRLKDRPDLRKKVAAYAAARGVSIDPNNLAQILDVLLAFFQKLLPLILQFVYHPIEPADYGGGPILVYV